MHDHSAAGAGESKQLYQCSMHPNVISDKPGTCPICAMDLQPVKKIDAKGIPGRAPVQITGQQEQLINIRTVPVKKESVEQTIRAVGRVVVNEEKTGAINSRVMGWVEKLNVDTTGETVEKGQPLMAIYSPDLYSAQQDYLIAARQGGSLAEAARKRLELWGISDAQITELKNTGKPTNTLELTAPLSGTVIEKNVVPAQMIQPGMTLYKIADLSEVWVQAEFYESELPFVEKGQKTAVTVPAYPGREWDGVVDFIYPFLEGKTRTNVARLVFDNPDGLLKPDMYANVEIRNDLGEQLSVPAGAVFDTGKQQYVFVKQSDGVFVPTLVELGPRVGERQVIRSGVQAGDAVVVDGNFLLDSESQLKAAASGSDEEAPEEQALALADMPGFAPLPAAARPLYAPLIETYLAIHARLAADTFEGVANDAVKLREEVKVIAESNVKPPEAADAYQKRVQALEASAAKLTPANLEEARVAFGRLSDDLIVLLTQFPPPVEKPLQVMKCPMWQKSPGRWLQTGEATENPFMGQAMLSCGEAVTTIDKGQ